MNDEDRYREKPVHYPANPDKFEFDEQVAKIFPDMADRSIPIYRNMHRLHAKILVDDYIERARWAEFSGYTILDIGASRADFYNAIIEEFAAVGIEFPSITYTACDKSEAMIEVTQQESGIRILPYDLADPNDHAFKSMKYDAVVMHIVMQFIPPEQRTLAYRRLAEFTKPEGLLFYGEKETLRQSSWWSRKEIAIAEAAHEFYIDFRVENGYSREEIEAKTKALKNAMWESCYETDTKRNLEFVGFGPIIPTTRLGVFHSFVAIRGH